MRTHPIVRAALVGALALALPAARPSAVQAQAPTPSAAPTAARLALAKRLVALLRVQETSERTMQAAVEGMTAGMQMRRGDDPALAGVMRAFMRDEIAWRALEAEYVAAYAETFTEDELRGLVAFYESAAGRALVDRTPALTTRTSAAMAQRMQAVMPTLVQRIDSAQRARAGRPVPDARR